MVKRQGPPTDRHGCAPQKVDPTSRRNSFEPVFMVQPAENIVRCYPAISWQLMPMDAWARGTGRVWT
jgi:hypothetical protein